MKETIQKGLFVVPQWPIQTASKVWEAYPQFEGLVFKDSGGKWGTPYGRMKRSCTMDYICMGFELSDSPRHAGWGVASVLGGLLPVGKVNPVVACHVSGLSDELRREFFNNPHRYMGRVFEAKGKKVTKKGALRHPDFVRWREDKMAGECLWDFNKESRDETY